MDLDPVRTPVLELIEDREINLKQASLAIGRNAAYLHQFIFLGTPKILPEDVRGSSRNISAWMARSCVTAKSLRGSRG